MKKDPYKVLGVDRKADDQTIKRAHRRKVRKLHPDTSGGDVVLFREVQQAYETLRDPKRRQLYDEWGDDSKDPDAQATKNLVRIMMDVIRGVDVKCADVVKHTRKVIQDGQAKLRQDIVSAGKKIELYHEAKKRLKPADSPVHRQIDVEIVELTKQQSAFKFSETVGIRMLTLIEQYEYQHESIQPVTAFPGLTSNQLLEIMGVRQ